MRKRKTDPLDLGISTGSGYRFKNYPFGAILSQLIMNESAAENTLSRDKIIEVLKTIEDPELFLDIWFLGLIYNIDIKEGHVIIEMTFTSPMCPAGPLLIDKVKTGIGTIPGVSSVEVKIVFNPPWTPSDDVRAMLGLI